VLPVTVTAPRTIVLTELITDTLPVIAGILRIVTDPVTATVLTTAVLPVIGKAVISLPSELFRTTLCNSFVTASSITEKEAIFFPDPSVTCIFPVAMTISFIYPAKVKAPNPK
jgi:hypothetical protein